MSMKETQISEEGGPDAFPKNGQDISRAIDTLPQKSRESLWGAVLFAGMIVFVIVSLWGIGWAAYSGWKSDRTEKNQPSIGSLAKQSEGTEVSSAEPSQAADAVRVMTADKQAVDVLAEAKKLEISVLNGGGAKGSAGALADFLKGEGYLKTDAGNATKDYSGVTVYYAANLEKEAAIVTESIMKKYPQAKPLPADANDKETSASQVTVILGK